MRAAESSGSSALIWFWTLLGTLLPIICLWYYGPRIESDLTTRVTAALASVGFDTNRVFLRVDGRDVIFSGEMDAALDQNKMISATEGIRGVRQVVNQLRVFERAPSRLKVTAAEGTASLEGVLPDLQSVQRVVQSLEDVYGQGQIADELRIDSKASEPQWTDTLPGFLSRLDPADTLTVEISEAGILLTGQVNAEEKRAELGAQAQSLSGDLAVDNQITVEITEEARMKAAQESIRALDLPEIKFQSLSAELTEAGSRILDVVSTVLKKYPEVRVEIGGHTDAQGDAELNMALSRQRASSVHSYLVSRGLDAASMEIKGYGETLALADNDTPEGRAKNRRIEFKVIQ